MDKKNKNPNVPNLRFAGYIDNYRTCKLIDISEIVTRTNENNSEYPIMMISAGKGFIAQSEKYSRDNAGTSINKYILLKKGELAYNRGNSKQFPYGAIYEMKEECALIPYVYHCFNIYDESTRYFSHYLNSPFKDEQLSKIITSSVRGNGLLNISKNDFFNLSLNVPSIKEQNKIAKFLDLIDQRIQTQSKIINSIESQIRAINNHIASDSTSSELNIASLFHVKTSNKLVESNTGKFCIVDMGTIDANGNYITGKYTDDETSLIPYGTLVMPKDDIGGGKIICKTMCINSSNKYALSDHVFALKLKNDKYNPVYFSALINSQYNNHKLKKLVTGSAQLGINQENLNRYKLKFSDSLELQNKYSEIIFRLNEELIIEKRLLDLFSSQKKYLLKNMFV